MKRAVVIGGGTAGLEFVRHAKDLPLEIILIEPKPILVCQALLPEFISYKVSEEDLSVKIKPFCDEIGAEFVRDYALKVEDGRVLTKKREIEYDFLIIATGAQPNTFENTFSIGTLEDAIKTRKALENADDVVVIGSGATGVEAACEVAEFYNANVKIVEYFDRILPAFKPDVSQFVEEILRKDRIGMLTSCAVSKAEEGKIITNRGEVNCDLAIACAGLKPNGFNVDLLRVKGWIKVDEFLRAKENIFAIGDCALVNIDGKTATKTALEAEMQAKHVAENIDRILKGKELKKYKIRSSIDGPVSFITLAKKRAVLVYRKHFLARPMSLLYLLKKQIVSIFLNKYKP